MKNYLFVETRDLIETRDVEWSGGLAATLARKNSHVVMFLTENGVLAARGAYDSQLLRILMKRGVKVLADRFALAERGVTERDLANGIEPADISFIAEQMSAGVNVIWR